MTARRVFGAPFSWLFGLVVRLRRLAYDRRWLAIERVSVPVISVGNIAAGGTGKTPIVEWIARMLQDRGLVVGVLSRGYGRRTHGFRLAGSGNNRSIDPDEVGDEPAQLVQALRPRGLHPAVVVAVDEDRIRGARRLVRDHGVQVIVLDDGFQHRRLSRDLDVVLLTEDDVLHGGALLPAGHWREPFDSIERAGAIVVTRCSSSDQGEMVRKRIQDLHIPVVGMRTAVRSVFRASTQEEISEEDVRSMRAFLLAGIGYPEGFRRTVIDLGAEVVSERYFRDHHRFTTKELDQVQGEFRRSDATHLLTTEKDAVRLQTERGKQFLQECPVVVVAVRPEFVGDPGPLKSMIVRVAHAH